MSLFKCDTTTEEEVTEAVSPLLFPSFPKSSDCDLDRVFHDSSGCVLLWIGWKISWSSGY
jgi:hypothetical protein